ncbi:FG-GAP-like repeat-containing protein [Streptomyces sp. NPDC000410]|uniref:FG-GAP-like repeat-containing protein n=1 Tax=Streptomyces sp. NPDC000410 TaxID=3154254 RepID=UPI003325381A
MRRLRAGMNDPGGSRRRGVSVVAVTVLSVGMAALPPVESGASSVSRNSDTGPSVSLVEKQRKEADAAERRAAKTGKPVEIISERTETDQTYANPDGTFTVDRYLVPQRVRQNGKLIPVDARLAIQGNGRVAPKATGLTVSFSGGGDSAFATMVKDGREVALSWPGKLPKPILSGDTATYREVLPGVDLTATATVDAFSHALVVKNAQAAKSPKLDGITFGLKSKGLALKTGANGEIRALDPTGRAVFSAPKPQMWDSAGVKAGKPGGKGKPLPVVRPLAEVLDGATEGSQQADIGAKLTGRTLTLTPDKKLLTDPGTVFPVVIDPIWAKDALKNAWSVAYKHTAYPSSDDTVYYNGGTLSKEARVGVAIDPDGGTVSANTYFRIATGNVWGKQIIRSTLRIKQTYAGSWSCKSGDILVKDIGKALPSNITWNRQPASLGTVDSSGESFGGRNCPADSAGLVEFDVTSAISKAAKGKYPAWAFGLFARNSTVDVSWRKFDPNSVRISTYLNTPPVKPANPSTNPSVPCGGGTFGITDYVTLRVTVNDAEDNNLKAQFQYGPVGATAAPVRPTKVAASRGTVASLRIDTRSLTSGTYWWNVVVDDGTANSPVSDTCRFTYDGSAPSKLPGVSSPQFPADRDGSPARSKGEFFFTNGGVSDVTHWMWWTDSDTTERFVYAKDFPDPAHPPKVDYTPLSTGPQYMHVRSIDAAGNRSAEHLYLFYATRSPERDKPGDLNGDGNVDLWSVDPGDGALWVHPGQGNGKFAVGAHAAEASFGEAAVTHRGAWNERDYDEDLVALRPGAEDPARKELWVYENEGDGTLDGTEAGSWELEVMSDETDNHWHNADQILSIGSMNDDNGDGVLNEADDADLLVKSGSELWLYLGSRATNLLDAFVPPIPLGNADWQDMTLLGPGDLNKDGLPELWVRDAKAGTVHQYTSRANPNAGDTAADLSVYGDAAVRTTSIGSGFTSAAYPHLSTEGDFEGDGFADLWARDGVGASVEFPGRALTNNSAFGSARPLVTSGTPWGTCEVFESTATGRRSLCGPILAKYKALGGPAKFGYPSTDVKTPGDGVGRYVHFRAPGTTADNRSIYWSPDTGAWSVVGSIWTKWTAMGRESGALGYPTSDERPTSDGVGRVTAFSKGGKAGAIYFASGIGAFSTQGAVYAKYLELNGPRTLGYPTNDVTATSPKAGSYQRYRFRHEAADSSSIYWSSATGAWPVSNEIRAKWNSLQSENSWLGFPVSVEYDVAGGTRTDFEGGYVRLYTASGIATEHKSADKTESLRRELSGDVNGDGRSDMITVYNYGGATTGFHLLEGNAEGGFNPPKEAWVSGRGGFDYTRSKWVSGDFDADGHADVAAFYGYADGSVATWTFYGEADGTFKRTAKSAVINPGSWTWSASEVLGGDFNGDKRKDLAVFYDLGNATSRLYTFTAKADGSFNLPFASWTSSAGGWDSSRSQAAAGDFNGDGREELVARYAYDDDTEALWYFVTSATGSFTSGGKGYSGDISAVERGSVGLVSVDFNGDKRVDVAILRAVPYMRLSVFAGKSDGGFEAPGLVWNSLLWGEKWVKGYTGDLLSGDANADGRADLAMMYGNASGASRAYTFVGKSEGAFGIPQPSWHAEPGTW